MQRRTIKLEDHKKIPYRGTEYYELEASEGIVDPKVDLAFLGNPNESWFIVGNLKHGEDRISVQVHMQRNQIGPIAIMPFSVNVVNETTGKYKTSERLYKKRDVTISKKDFHITSKELDFYGTPDKIYTHVDMDGIKIDLVSVRHDPIIKVNTLGFLEFIGVEQYDFALPRMETSGTVSIDGDSYEVTGISWLDRQWGGLPKQLDGNKGMSGLRWTWLNPQMSNGCNITMGQIINFDAKAVEKFADISLPDGSLISANIDIIETLEEWISPNTGNKYPTKMHIRIPALDTDLIAEVPYKEQEILSKIPDLNKYEGAILVTGTMFGKPVTGEGFAEHVGGAWK